MCIFIFTGFFCIGFILGKKMLIFILWKKLFFIKTTAYSGKYIQVVVPRRFSLKYQEHLNHKVYQIFWKKELDKIHIGFIYTIYSHVKNRIEKRADLGECKCKWVIGFHYQKINSWFHV